MQIKARKADPNRRITDKWWAELPPPAKVTKTAADMVELIEPEDIWTSASDYEKDKGYSPESVGIQCEWVTRRSGKEWGFWTQSVQPLKRQRKSQQILAHDTELDNSIDQLSADQLTKRFAAEVDALNKATGGITQAQLSKLEAASSEAAPDDAPVALDAATHTSSSSEIEGQSHRRKWRRHVTK